MTRRTVRLSASVVAAAALLACLLALLAGTRDAGAAFPGENGRIVFSSDRDDPYQDFDIYTVRPDGSGLRQLIDAPGYDVSPEWSPDGSKIAFVSNRDGDFDIYVMDLATGEVSRLTDDDPAIPAKLRKDHSPAFSPNGKKIAFSSTRDKSDADGNTEDVYVMNTDGSEVTRLTDTEDYVRQYEVSWSPDGARLLLERRSSSRSDIGILNADGSGWSSPFPPTPFIDEGSPDWSPSGEKIVFTRDTEDPDRYTTRDVWKVNPDGSGLKQLTNTPNVYESYPDWSPDGRRIAFGRIGDLFTMRASDGSDLKRLTNTPGYSERSPDWRVKPRR